MGQSRRSREGLREYLLVDEKVRSEGLVNSMGVVGGVWGCMSGPKVSPTGV